MADDQNQTDPFAAISATLRKQKDDLDRHIRLAGDSSEETSVILKKLVELRERAEKSRKVVEFDGDSTRRS